jgi:hypothetical protein
MTTKTTPKPPEVDALQLAVTMDRHPELPGAAAFRFFNRYGVKMLPFMPAIMDVDDTSRALLDAWFGFWGIETEFSKPAARYTIFG